MLTKRLVEENFRLKNLRAFYRYKRNERKIKSDNFITIGSLSFQIKRYGQRNCRCRNKHNH